MSHMEDLLAIACGGVFGFALDSAKTNVPFVISEQMRMDNWTMFRMFLSASASSAAVVLLLHKLGLKERKPVCGMSLGLGPIAGMEANLFGGMMLGMGMYLSGSCPGTVWAQIGAGMPYVSSVIAGGMAGTIMFGYAEKIARSRNPNFGVKCTPEKSDAAKFLGFTVTSLAFIAVAIGAIFAVNHIFPWEQELAKVVEGGDLQLEKLASNPYNPEAPVWDPAFAGLALGLLQIPVQLSSGNALGQSSGWVYMSSYIAGAVDPNIEVNAPYLVKGRTRKGLFQILTGGGIALGAFLSQYLAGHPVLIPEAQNGCGSHAKAFIGGMLLLLGARTGNGCTSGHGLSGCASLSLASFISVMGMFAGGMGLALLV